jgi:hypothetical protein
MWLKSRICWRIILLFLISPQSGISNFLNQRFSESLGKLATKYYFDKGVFMFLHLHRTVHLDIRQDSFVATLQLHSLQPSTSRIKFCRIETQTVRLFSSEICITTLTSRQLWKCSLTLRSLALQLGYPSSMRPAVRFAKSPRETLLTKSP